MPTLDWIGKKAVLNHHREVPYHLLQADEARSLGDINSGNFLIQGDNLIALKALLPYYKESVKCIYIDPPYNTGNENWIFNDAVNSPEIKSWLGKVVGANSEDLTRHDKWLCMMYPRLSLLRELLREDGIIFISIDETEVTNLRLIMDEIFGPNNFIECITWNKRIPKNDAGIGNIHEYILIYRKSTTWAYNLTMRKDGLEKVNALLEQMKKSKTPIPTAEQNLRALYKKEKYDRGVTLYNSLDKNYRPWGKINMSWPNANTFGPRYKIPHPLTKRPVKIPDRGWRWRVETFEKELGDKKVHVLHDGSVIVGRIWFDQNENTQPSSIKYLDEVSRILLRSVLSLKSDGGIELENILGSKAKFAYPKPTNLISILIDSVQMNDGDIVFDAFAGSGTTADAVQQVNERDGINRNWIMVEIDPNVSSNVTHVRLKKNHESKRLSGFRYCKLGGPLFDETGNINKSVSFWDLASHIYFIETGKPIPKPSKSKSRLLS